MENAKLETYEEAATRLRLSVKTVKTLVKHKKIKAIRLTARTVRFRIYDLENFINRKTSEVRA